MRESLQILIYKNFRFFKILKLNDIFIFFLIEFKWLIPIHKETKIIKKFK